ncbi:MAG: hypothetical protein ACLP59_01815 [Bryobacteraceae bacterium]
MGHYPYTPFNGLTLLVLVLSMLVVWWRFQRPLSSNWPLIFYAAIAGHTVAFSYGLNPYWVAAGVACALAIRAGIYAAWVRWVELVPIGYVVWRSVALMLMW